jgi:hypothetical protein
VVVAWSLDTTFVVAVAHHRDKPVVVAAYTHPVVNPPARAPEPPQSVALPGWAARQKPSEGLVIQSSLQLHRSLDNNSSLMALRSGNFGIALIRWFLPIITV